MSTRRLYKVRYLYRLTADSICRGDTRTATLIVEQPNIAAAVRVGATLARRHCRSFGDEVFLRVVGVKEKGEVHRG